MLYKNIMVLTKKQLKRQQRKQSKRRQQRGGSKQLKNKGGWLFDTLANVFGYELLEQSEAKKLQESYNNNTTILAKKNAEIEELTVKVQKLETQSASNPSEKLAADLAQAQLDLAKAQEEQRQLIIHLDEKTAALSKIQEQIKLLTDKAALSETEQSQLKGLLKQKEAQLAQLSSENSTLQAQIVANKTQIDTLEAKEHKSTTDLKQIQALQDENRALQSSLDELKTKLEAQVAEDVIEDREAKFNKQYIALVTDKKTSTPLPTTDGAPVSSGVLYSIQLEKETNVSTITCAGLPINSIPNFSGFIDNDRILYLRLPPLYGLKPLIIGGITYNLTFSTIPIVNAVYSETTGQLKLLGLNLELLGQCKVLDSSSTEVVPELYFVLETETGMYLSDRTITSRGDNRFTLEIYNTDRVYVDRKNFEITRPIQVDFSS